MQQIAKAAGVGKQTLYRRWPGKAQLVLAAFRVKAESSLVLDNVLQLPIREALTLYLQKTVEAFNRFAPALRSLMAAAQQDETLCQQLSEVLIEPRRNALRAVLEAGIERGEITIDSDLVASVICLYGALWYRLLLRETLDAGFVDQLVSLVLDGVGKN